MDANRSLHRIGRQMTDVIDRSAHTFCIPVMGTGYLIDAPLRVARYGISSVISLVDDVLIEQMRRFHSEKEGEPYEEIKNRDEDARARRITAYLDMMDRVVARQVAALQESPFEPGSEITRYFELLPDCPLRDEYEEMLVTDDPDEKLRLQEFLRPRAVPGSIDVNIMSKLDRDVYVGSEKLPPEMSDASAALRGFCNSTVRSSIVFSAGLNPRLYAYAASFDNLYPDGDGNFEKKIILKVSDYKSAAIQGKYLAKRGLWVSEFRIESGLNCGGHAFATRGHLMGPILEEFQDNRDELVDMLHQFYIKGLKRAGHDVPASVPELSVTVQGGIGTAEEDTLLRQRYGVDGTGWGTPFLLVPEVTNVDEEHLEKLVAATDDDVYLSDSSPLGVSFWNLRDSASEQGRRRRIAEGNPGSACSKGYLAVGNTEFTEKPICLASRNYQHRKLKQLEAEDISEEQRDALRKQILVKSCICHDLAGGATVKHEIDPKAEPALCCGPNIVNFGKIASLEEMVGHIYGRLSLLVNPERPHMFIKELSLYVAHLRDETEKLADGLSTKAPEYFNEFRENLLEGIEHYRGLAGEFVSDVKTRFLDELERQLEALEAVALAPVPAQ